MFFFEIKLLETKKKRKKNFVMILKLLFKNTKILEKNIIYVLLTLCKDWDLLIEAFLEI